MKKFAAVLLTLVLVISLAAFGSNDVSADEVKVGRPKVSLKTSGDSITVIIKKTSNAEDFSIFIKGSNDDKYYIIASVEANTEGKTKFTIDNLVDDEYSIKVKAYKGLTPSKTSKVKKITVATREAYTGFYITEITDEIFARIKGKSFKDNCTVPREDLRYLHVLHKDLDGNTHEGEMIVNYHIAEDVLDILKTLYEADYPIERIRLVDEYDADDETSMRDNNSSSFNFRFISHTTRVSKHGLGLAVDINTLYNPYTKVVDGERIIEPATGEPYLDRTADFPYKIDENDLCYKLFIEKGFEWGGSWTDRKDYQHFEIPTDVINEWYPENA